MVTRARLRTAAVDDAKGIMVAGHTNVQPSLFQIQQPMLQTACLHMSGSQPSRARHRSVHMTVGRLGSGRPGPVNFHSADDTWQ